jgi:hypothetical protein
MPANACSNLAVVRQAELHTQPPPHSWPQVKNRSIALANIEKIAKQMAALKAVPLRNDPSGCELTALCAVSPSRCCHDRVHRISL